MIAYKYRGGNNFKRDLDSIAGDYFYAASLDTLNDPFEATYSIEPIEKLVELMKLVIGQEAGLANLKDSLHQMLSSLAKAGIFSLAARPDDRKLWAHYGSNYTGFCVGYEVEMLEKFNSHARHSNYLIRVKYDKQPAALDILDVMKPNLLTFLQKVIGTKHPEWEHEAETRIITDKVGKIPHDFRAIKSIHFGLHMPSDQIEEVMERMQGRGITYYKMQRSPSAYEFSAVSLVDPFIKAPRYLYQLAPVDDGALETYAQGNEKLELLPYLHKAVEVQRRDPYCTKVSCAERCSSKDRIGQIYVNYLYGEQFYNRYFTRDEIEELYAQITDLTN
jgi:hypothetical protein